MLYNKLVRDKIPSILAEKGMKVTFRKLKDDELKEALKAKLIEEVNELINAQTIDDMIEEMADVEWVLFAIMGTFSQSPVSAIITKVEEVGRRKAQEKGDFSGRYFLESAE